MNVRVALRASLFFTIFGAANTTFAAAVEEIVITAQKREESLMDVPQSVMVINKALMQSQGATSLSSAVRNVPGITLGAAEGSQIGNNINIDGFSARTDLFIDGMRDRGQYYRDTFALDQIEILFGPSSLLFGRGSTGGVINQVMKKPGLKKATELSVSAGIGW